MVDLRHVPHSKPFDLIDVLGNDDEALLELLLQKLTEIFQARLDASPPYLTLVDWGDSDGLGGPPPQDPTTLHLMLPFNEDCVYVCTLTELITETIEDHIGRPGDKIQDANGIEICHTIAAHLRELADQLDAACAK